jgi:membrane-bound lytic murein transglycosylase D
LEDPLLTVLRTVLLIALIAMLPLAASAATGDDAQHDSFASSLVVSVATFFGLLDAAPAETAVPAPRVVAAARQPVEHELKIAMRPEVRKYVEHYAKGNGRRTTVDGLKRSGAYCERAEQIFAEVGVPTELVWLAQVESGWKAEAVSPVGAGGVWQFMPATARDYGMRVDETVDERLDFDKSTRASARYLKRLARRYDGNWELAIAAYNYGEGNVDKACAKAGVEDFWVLCNAGLLPDETESYVPKVLAVATIGSNPAAHGLPNAG